MPAKAGISCIGHVRDDGAYGKCECRHAARCISTVGISRSGTGPVTRNPNLR